MSDPYSLHVKNQLTLCCPSCGDDEGYLHHTDITVFSRPVEDGPVTETRVHHDGSVRTFPPDKGRRHNPSNRRDGLAIAFWCEHCGEGHELTLEQHKGFTYVNWRKLAPGTTVHPFVIGQREWE
jgi:hypothetical protein